MKPLITREASCLTRSSPGLTAFLILFPLLVGVFSPRVLPASLPLKYYIATNLPTELEGAGARIDDAGRIYGATLTIPTEFLIYDPAATGPNSVSVRHIPSPIVPGLRRFGIGDINQKGQFIAYQMPQGSYGHNFLWNGAKFVEFKPLPPDDIPGGIPGYPDLVASRLTHPGSIQEDGSSWGTVDPTFGKPNDYGSLVRWDLGGKPTVLFSFLSEDDPLRIGPGPNERGTFLRSNKQEFSTGLLITNTAYWDGKSAILGTPIPHPPSVIVQLNDLDEVVGITADKRELWLYLPAPHYGLDKGYHLLSGVSAASQPYLFFNNLGQIFVATTDAEQPSAVWDNGLWRGSVVEAPDNSVLELRILQHSNARGDLLAFLGTKGPPAPLKEYLLTPSNNLVVKSEVTPRMIDVGQTFDLELDIRNDTPVTQYKVGIVVSSFGFSGAVVGDWIKAPPSLLTLPSGASGKLHYIFRAKAAGTAQLRYQVEGLNASGQRQTITARVFSPVFTVTEPPPLDVALTTDLTNVEIDEEFDVTAAIRNASTQTIHAVQLSPEHLSVQGTGAVEFKTGPTPPLLSSLDPGTRQVVKLRFKAKEPGAIVFKVSALGKRADNSDATSLVATSRVVRIGIKGDLLINRVGEPDENFALDDVYQQAPIGAQSKTNVITGTREASFRVRIQNDSKLSRTYRLSAFEGAPQGWDVAYRLGNADITAAVRSGNGVELPELASHAQIEVLATLKLTNAIPGEPKRVTLALSSPLAPNETLDAVEAVARLPQADIVGIEVNQVVQDWRNSVTLIAGKSTLVRVFPQLQTGTRLSDAIRGRLRGYRDGVELSESPLNSREYAVVVLGNVSTNREDFDTAFNFDLPLAWSQGSVKLQFEPIDFKPRYLEPSERGGQEHDGIVEVSFVAMPELPVVIHLVHEQLNSGNTDMVSARDVADAIRRLETLFPVARLDWHMGFSPKAFARDLNGVGDLDQINKQIFLDPSYLQCPTVLACSLHLGLLNYRKATSTDTQFAGGGLAAGVPSSVVTARLFPIGSLATAPAHELAHALGRSHSVLAFLGATKTNGVDMLHGTCEEYSSLGTPDYPHFHVIQGHLRPTLGPMGSGEDLKIFGFDQQRDEIVPPDLPEDGFVKPHFDLMSYCDPVWMSKHTYEAIREAIQTRFGAPAPLRPQGQGQPLLQMVLRGELDIAAGAASLLPIREILTGVSVVPPGPGPFRLEILGPSGAVTSFNDFQATPNLEDPAAASSFFFVLPEPEDFNGLRIRRGETVLLSKVASAHAPSVRLISPNGEEQLASDEITLRWEASDADGDPLRYGVEFSADAGASWNALGVDLAETELKVPRSLLRGTTTGLIRVQASDGLRTATDTSDATFTVVDNPPQVFAISPTEGRPVAQGQRVLFEAAAFDPEDGRIPDAKLKWTSSLSGDLGTGLTFDRPAAALPVGTHLITLAATDSAGHTSTTTTALTIVKHRPARLGVPRVTSDGRLEVEVFGSIGATNLLQTSTNLSDWVPASKKEVLSNVETMHLDLPPNGPPLFLRVLTD